MESNDIDRYKSDSPKKRARKESRYASTRYDTMDDDVYQELDPIDSSLKMRVARGGHKAFVVRDIVSRMPNVLFDLKWKETAYYD